MSQERQLDAALKTRDAILELEKCLRRERKILEMKTRRKNRPLRQLRNSTGNVSLLKMHLAKRLAYYKAEKEADEIFPGHGQYA